MITNIPPVSERTSDAGPMTFNPTNAAQTAPTIGIPSVHPPATDYLAPGTGINPDTAPGRTHTPFGIASLIIATLVGITSIWLFVGMVILGSLMPQPGEPVRSLLGLLIMGCIAIAMVSLTLGIIGLFQRNRKKFTAILGSSGSSITVVGWIMLIIIGMLTG
jgi:hypothetical protein